MAGELPLEVIELVSRMLSRRHTVRMEEAGPGFTLPANIGALNSAITALNLERCCLIG